MLFLAIETSGLRGSLALFAGGACLREAVFEEGLVHGRELTARLDESLALEGLRARSLQGIAVAAGPGSYTGIRVGVTAAKSLAFALGIPVIAESSLRLLAANAAVVPAVLPPAEAPSSLRIAAVMDARRSQFFGAFFEVEPRPGGLSVRRLCPDIAAGPPAILEAISSAPTGADGAVLVVGDGAEAFLREARVGTGGPGGFVRGPTGWDAPSARVLGLLAAEDMAAALFDAEAIHSLQPAYLRLTEAERKLASGRTT